MSLTDKRLATKTLEDTVYNTVAAMANHLVRYNNTESNVLVSTYNITSDTRNVKIYSCSYIKILIFFLFVFYSFTTNY